MQSQKRFPIIRLSLLLLAINQAHANDFSASVSASSQISDNSKKTSSAEEAVEERQDIYRLGLRGDYSNWLIDADVDYQLYAQKFAKQSQEDEEYADGSATLVFGKDHNPVGLELSHSRRMLLRSPSDVALLQNMQEREIISAQPVLRTRLSAADLIYVMGRAENVRFIDGSNQDSKRNGGSFGWAHAISKTSAFNLGGHYTDIKFDRMPASDYSLAGVNLAYSVKLRSLDYIIDIGYNETAPEIGEKESAPTYNIRLGYDTGYNMLEVYAGRQITDSSFGNGNLAGPGQIPGTDGFSQNLSKIDRKTVGLNFSSKAICTRCTFTLGASLTDDDYLERDEDMRNTYYRSSFAYAISEASSISLRLDRSEYKQEQDFADADHEMNYLSLEFTHTFASGFDIRLFGRAEKRTSDQEGSNYKENIVGIGLGFVF